MQPTGNLVPETPLTAIFMSNKLDSARISQTIRHIRQITAELTIVMTDPALPKDSIELPKEKLFFVPLLAGSIDVNLCSIIKRAAELSPKSERFMVFLGENPRIPSNSKYAILEKRKDDFVLLKDLQCMILSNRYAKYIAMSGEIPSIMNALRNGFSSRTSLMQVIKAPKIAAREYSTLIKFAVVGASGVIVNLVMLSLLKIWIAVNFANAMAVELSIVNNFVWNDSFTFNSGKVTSARNLTARVTRFVKYNIVSLVSLAVNETVFIYANSHGIWYIWSSILAIGAAFVVNYFGSSRWAWRFSLISAKSVKN